MSFASWIIDWWCARNRPSRAKNRQVMCRYLPALQELEPRLAPAGLSPVASFINTSGDNPYCPVIEDASGNLFGTTSSGGTSGGYGTVFEVKAGSGAVTTLATFNNANGADPEGGLVEDASGNLFGTTVQGGAYNDGTVFEVKAGSSAITTLASFNNVDGARPHAGVIEDASGNLFGTTYYGGINAFVPGYGTVFEVKAGSGTITTLAAFNNTDGANPYGGLVEDAGGNLFGTTVGGGASGDGTVFEVQAGSGAITTLASFNGSNGSSPYGGLVEDAGGNLFGTVHGSNGSVFEVQAGSGTITTLATFNGSNGSNPLGHLVKDAGGNLFGATSGGGSGYGTIFEVKSGSGAITTLATFNGSSGSNPQGGPIEDAGGNLFGTTSSGGSAGSGTVFEVKAGSGAVTTLAAFGDANGSSPSSTLVEDATGDLFGTTSGGGSGFGTVFEVQAGSSAVTTLVAFNGTNGSNPQGSLVEDAAGNLYGVTAGGGALGYGTVFEVKAGSGAITTLASFNYSNGAGPQGGLIEDASGNLFGTTSGGGASGYGTVFEVKAGSGAITTIASFNNANGASPQGGLIEDAGGNLFGTTSAGGALSDGTVFEVKAGSGAITTLGTFNNANGANPQGSLVEDGGGNLFGTASAGGSSGFGTLFEVQAGSGVITVLASFGGLSGWNPYGGLVEDAMGDLFGTTAHGGNAGGYGTVFEMQAGSGVITTIGSFNNADGANPQAGLIEDANGNLLGAASGGGTSGVGAIFELTIPLLFGSAPLPGGAVGAAYSQAISAWGGAGAAVNYQVTAGTLPPGLTLNAGTGSLSGTPNSPGGAPYFFTVTASDRLGDGCSQTYSVAVASPLGTSSNAVYVENLYSELLHRGADAGAARWVNLLDSGVAPSTVVLDIEQSTEYLSDALASIYQHYLHRAPDAGAQVWVSLLAGGTSIEQVTAAIVSSPEYFARHGGSDAGFIEGLYQDILGRTASSPDVQGWVNALGGGATPAQVAMSFLTSQEYRANLVDSYFVEFLRRPADPGGRDALAQALASGMTDQEVLAVIFGSGEGYAKWS